MLGVGSNIWLVIVGLLKWRLPFRVLCCMWICALGKVWLTSVSLVVLILTLIVNGVVLLGMWGSELMMLT